jgi:polyvinyl alcohol dehydrogenase (cytochrome)
MEHVLNCVRQGYKYPWLRVLVVTGILITLVLAFLLPRLNVQADNTGWPSTYLGDNGRSNFNSSESIINQSTASSLHLQWTQKKGTEAPITSQPLVANGMLYWSLWSGHVHAGLLNNGHFVWTQFVGLTNKSNCEPPKGGAADTPTVATVSINGQNTSVLFIGGGNSQFYALDAMTGKIIWHRALGNAYDALWGSPAIYNGDVYIGVSPIGACGAIQGQFFQLDAASGKLLNTFNVVPAGCIGGAVWGSPAIDEQTGMIYFGTGGPSTCSQSEPYANSVVELQASNLSYVASWQILSNKVNADFQSTPTLFSATINGVSTQMIGILSDNGVYYALDRSNLAAGPLWQDQLAQPEKISYKFDNAAGTWDGTTLYVAANKTTLNGTSCPGSLSAINPADGSFQWQDCLPDTPALWAMGVPGLVVVGSGATFSVVNATDGTVLFSFTNTRPGAVFQGSASISGGVLYIGDNHGDLYAFVPSGSAHK